jgi:hypothetical protein
MHGTMPPLIGVSVAFQLDRRHDPKMTLRAPFAAIFHAVLAISTPSAGGVR